MPKIVDTISNNKRKRKFVAKRYRAWDYQPPPELKEEESSTTPNYKEIKNKESSYLNACTKSEEKTSKQQNKKKKASSKNPKSRLLSKHEQSISKSLIKHKSLSSNAPEKKISIPNKIQAGAKLKSEPESSWSKTEAKSKNDKTSAQKTNLTQAQSKQISNDSQRATFLNIEFGHENSDNIKQRHNRDVSRTIQGHIEDITETHRGHIEDITEAQTETTSKTFRGHFEDIIETNRGHNRDNESKFGHDDGGFSCLSRLQRRIVLFIYKSCQLSRGKISQPISSESLAFHCNTSIFSIKKTIQRLEKRGLLVRNNFKKGRDGWTKYIISNTLFQEIFHNENLSQTGTYRGYNGDITETFRGLNADISRAQTETQTRTLLPSSSSDINKTTTKPPAEWLEIDHSPIANIGFTEKHLWQWWEGRLCSADEAQESINHFAFDLQSNQKQFKTSPVNALMGIMRKSGYYNAPDNYQSPREIARKRRMAQLKQAQQELEELKLLEKKAWLEGLSREARETLLPNEIKQSKLKGERDAFLSGYFEEHIWPDIKKRYD